jgi:hypothetical protein
LGLIGGCVFFVWYGMSALLRPLPAFTASHLTSLNRRSENVLVDANIIPELELCNVEWHAFAANLVEEPTIPRLRSASDEAIHSSFAAPFLDCFASLSSGGALRGRVWADASSCDLPDGLSVNSGVQSPLAKFFAFPFGRNRNRANHPVPNRGAFRDRHGRRARDAMDAGGALDESR